MLSYLREMITTPDNLPKDRLKAELKKRGIKCNANENKSYYVDLYREKVMGPDFDRPRSEFSSDDEVKQSLRASQKKQVIKTIFLTHFPLFLVIY